MSSRWFLHYVLPVVANFAALLLNIGTAAAAVWRGDYPDHAIASTFGIAASSAAVLLLPLAYGYGAEKAAKAAAESDLVELMLQQMRANPEGFSVGGVVEVRDRGGKPN